MINEKFSKEHLQAVLDALIRVKGGEIALLEYGICFNARELLIEAGYYSYENVLSDLYSRWGKFSGDVSYPVPDPRGGDAGYVYKYTTDLWSGEYGALRYELLDFLINRLAKELSIPQQTVNCKIEGYEGELK